MDHININTTIPQGEDKEGSRVATGCIYAHIARGENGPHKLQAHDYNIEVTEGKTKMHKEGENRHSKPPIQLDMRPHGGCKGKTIPSTELADRTSPICNRKLDHNTHTPVTDEPTTVDASTGAQGVMSPEEDEDS